MPTTSVPPRAWTLPLVLVLWLAVPVPAAWYAFASQATFFAESPTAGATATSLLLWIVCALAAVGLPLVGAGVARTLDWRRAAIAFRLLAAIGALSVISLLLWLYVLGDVIERLLS